MHRNVPDNCVDCFCTTGARCPAESHSGVRRQFVRRLYARTQRSLSSFTRKKIARGRAELFGNERERHRWYNRRRLATPPHLKQRIDILFLELGINYAFRALPIDQIQNNLQQIIDKVKAKNPNARVLIAGMQLPGYTADDYVFAFGRMFTDLATKNRAALVPYLLQGVAGNPSLNLADGIHPNAAGQRILAENVWRVLEPVAREVAK